MVSFNQINLLLVFRRNAENDNNNNEKKAAPRAHNCKRQTESVKCIAYSPLFGECENRL